MLQNFGTTNINTSADADRDGASIGNEYFAGTAPTNAASVLEITRITRDILTPTYTTRNGPQ